MNKLRRWIASTLAVCVAAFQMPAPVLASDDAAAQLPEQDCVPGEAVVLTVSPALPLQQASALDAEVEWVKSCSFAYDNTMQTDDSAFLPFFQSSAALTERSFTVSLVRSESKSTDELVAYLKKMPDICYAEPNRTCTTQALWDTSDFLWGLNNHGQNGGIYDMDLHVESIRDAVQSPEDAVVIAVVDTGIDYFHPDLTDHIWQNPFADLNQDSEEGYPVLPGAHGYDFVDYDEEPLDENGHGTHCAGIIASAMEKAGISNYSLMPVRMLDDRGASDTYSEVEAYYYIYKALQLGVPVAAINNSWGGSLSYSNILNTLMFLTGELGAISVCAAGNDALNTDINRDEPSGFENPYVVSVAASDESDRLAHFSNYGAKTVDLAAPGVNILSTYHMPYFEPDAFSEEAWEAFVNGQVDFSDLPEIHQRHENDPFPSPTEEPWFAVDANGTSHSSFSCDPDYFFGTNDMDAASLCWDFTPTKTDEDACFYVVLPLAAAGNDRFDYRFFLRTEGADCDITVDSCYLVDGMLEADTATYVTELFHKMDAPSGWHVINGSFAPDTYSDDELYKQCVLRILVGSASYGECTHIYLDRLTWSNNYTIIDAEYPRYCYMSGTSMATPYVTAAAAIFSTVDPEANALDRVASLLSATRPAEDLDGYLHTGGVLDFSQFDPDKTILYAHTLDPQTSTLTISGKNISDFQIYCFGYEADIPVLSQSEDLITLDVSNFRRKFMNFGLYDAQERLLYRIREYCAYGIEPDTVFVEPHVAMDLTASNPFFSVGGHLYRTTESGFVMQYTETGDYTMYGLDTLEDCFGASVYFYGDAFAIVGNRYYRVMERYLEDFQTQLYLIAFDFTEKTWLMCMELPSEETSFAEPHLAAGSDCVWISISQSLPAEETEDPETESSPCEKLYCYAVDAGLLDYVTDLPVASYLNEYLLYSTGTDLFLFSMDLDAIQDQTFGTMWRFQMDNQTWYPVETLNQYPVETESYYDIAFGFACLDLYDHYLIFSAPAMDSIGDVYLYDIEQDLLLPTSYTLYPQQHNADGYQSFLMDDTLCFLYYCGDADFPGFATSTTCYCKAIAVQDLIDDAWRLYQKPSEILGDFNQDGKLDIQDASDLLAYYAKKASGQVVEEPSPQQFAVADLDRNGILDIGDCSAILKRYAQAAAGL